MLFIDPTIAQFGKVNGIIHEVYSAGDQNISKTLETKYNLMDVRFKLLLNKAINRVPVDQQPYPGLTIIPDAMTYYMQVLNDRNDVAGGQVPKEWEGWVNTLKE